MKVIPRLSFVIIFLVLSNLNFFGQTYKVIESGTEHIIIEFNFANSYKVIDTLVDGRYYQKIRGENHSYRNPGEPWLPEFIVFTGIPFDSKPLIKILKQKQSIQKNQFLIPYPEEDPTFVKQDIDNIDKDVYSRNELFPFSKVSIGESYIVRYANILPVMISP